MGRKQHLIQSAQYNHIFKKYACTHIFKQKGVVTVSNFYFLPQSYLNFLNSLLHTHCLYNY